MADRRPFNVSLSKTKLSVPQKTKQQQKTDSLFLLFSRTRKGPEAKVQTARTGIRDQQRLHSDWLSTCPFLHHEGLSGTSGNTFFGPHVFPHPPSLHPWLYSPPPTQMNCTVLEDPRQCSWPPNSPPGPPTGHPLRSRYCCLLICLLAGRLLTEWGTHQLTEPRAQLPVAAGASRPAHGSATKFALD